MPSDAAKKARTCLMKYRSLSLSFSQCAISCERSTSSTVQKLACSRPGRHGIGVSGSAAAGRQAQRRSRWAAGTAAQLAGTGRCAATPSREATGGGARGGDGEGEGAQREHGGRARGTAAQAGGERTSCFLYISHT